MNPRTKNLPRWWHGTCIETTTGNKNISYYDDIIVLDDVIGLEKECKKMSKNVVSKVIGELEKWAKYMDIWKVEKVGQF